MILTVLYADGIEEAYSVSENTKLRSLRAEDFFYFSVIDGGQVAIAAETFEKITLGTVDVTFERKEAHGRPDLAD